MRRWLAIFALLLSVPSGLVRADETELVLIANPQSGVETLSRDDVINIYMGRFRKLPSGLVAFPVDQASRSPERDQFYRQLLNKNLADVDAYWARLLFSGETTPPMQVPDTGTALDLVASNRNALAYIYRSEVTDRVRVVMTLGGKP